VADRVLLQLNIELKTLGRSMQHVQCRGGDLRADAVTRQNDDMHDNSLDNSLDGSLRARGCR
jgi:hypothetical protein